MRDLTLLFLRLLGFLDLGRKWPVYRTEKIPGKDLQRWVAPDRKKYAAYYRLLKLSRRQEAEWAAEDQKNLHRLIDIREYLWT